MSELYQTITDDYYSETNYEFMQAMELLWKQFSKVYARKFPAIKKQKLAGSYAIRGCGGIYDIPMEYYKIFFGCAIDSSCVKSLKLSVELPPQIGRIAEHFIAFTMKYGADYMADNEIKLTAVPDAEVDALVKASKMEVPKHVGIYSTVSIF